MIVYKLTDGFASDLRYEEASYALKLNELSIAGWGELPPIESFHHLAVVQAKKDAEAAGKQRLDTLRADALAADMFDKLRTATPQKISAYVDNNVTDLASARTMLKRILLVMALITNGR